MHAYEIVKETLEKFRGLAKSLSEITDKTEAWWNSHGREPKTENPVASGNVSPVTHYLRHVKLYEAAEAGAGKYLNELVYAELKCAFTEKGEDCVLRDLRRTILTEAAEALQALDEKELAEARKDDLRRMRKEVIDIKIAADNAVEQLTSELEKREIRRSVFGDLPKAA